MNIEQIAIEVADELFLDKITVGYNSTEFLRRCLEKFAEHVDMEPVSYLNPHGGVITKLSTGLERETFTIKLYTETQLLAAQQKAAEACARVCENETDEQWIDSDAWYAAKNCRDQIRNGDWREYL